MNRRIQVFDYKIFNSLLDQAELCSYLHYGVFYNDVKEDFSLQNHSFVKFNPKVITLTTKYGLGENFNLPTTYIFNRDDSVAHLKTGAEEYAIFKRAARAFLPDYSNDPIAIKKLGKLDGKFLNKQAGLLKFNPKYNGKKIFAFEYDLNAAYLSCMAERWLDTRFAMYDHILNEKKVRIASVNSNIPNSSSIRDYICLDENIRPNDMVYLTSKSKTPVKVISIREVYPSSLPLPIDTYGKIFKKKD